MTMKIEVTIPHEAVQSGEAGAYLASAMQALGFARQPQTTWALVKDHAGQASDAAPTHDYPSSLGEAIAASPEKGEWAEAPKRERGKPAPGRARRTKEEIAEDEAADKADASAPVSEPVAAISTSEERIDPATAEDEAQDAEDEAAEAETTKPATLTHDDVRAALKGYLDAFGTPAAMEDGPKVLKMLFGEGASKVSDVPDDQASLAKAVAGIKEMLVKNPFSRQVNL